MAPSRLPNYLRACRKRALLSQAELAYLLGSRSSAGVSRHERFQQTPNLPTLLAYEILFRTPVRKLVGGMHDDMEHKVRERVRRLVRKLNRTGRGPSVDRKLAILNAFLEETA